ncbi:NlpC/P60 family protein [Streptomyces hydrogenans]|uniref:NlpC/P60 family protein n=1 Tax=Streptomyces hydrogenans TaxID=1873719 RepID=UPI003646C884
MWFLGQKPFLILGVSRSPADCRRILIHRSSSPRERASVNARPTRCEAGDLIFWDTDPDDGIRYGGDLDHTGIYIGGGQAIDANAYYGRVKYDTVTLGGTERDPIYVDVLTPNGY